MVREIERTFAATCDRKGFRLVHYSLQGNHAHLIVEADDESALGRGMKALGARLARAVNRVFRRSGPVLADRYHVRVLRTPREVRNALAYVLLNARRHAAKAGRRLSRAVAIDPASSARWFDGWRRRESPVVEDAERSPPSSPAISPPRSWLLTEGWRRRGLLDSNQIPGRRGSDPRRRSEPARMGAAGSTARVHSSGLFQTPRAQHSGTDQRGIQMSRTVANPFAPALDHPRYAALNAGFPPAHPAPSAGDARSETER